MPMTLIAATNNAGKLRELRRIFSEADISLLSVSEAGIDAAEPEETGSTFAENAAIKARAAFERAKGLSWDYILAEDSGLCVVALGGEPGVRSKRFFGENLTDSERNEKLLALMRDVEPGNRGAYYECVICLIDPSGGERFFEGQTRGEILLNPRGENGFGYDPVFGVGNRSAAELSMEEKNAISHRGAAAAKLLAFLRSESGE